MLYPAELPGQEEEPRGITAGLPDAIKRAFHGMNRPGIAGGSGLPQVERRRITGFCCHNREAERYGKERLLVGVSTARFGFG